MLSAMVVATTRSRCRHSNADLIRARAPSVASPRPQNAGYSSWSTVTSPRSATERKKAVDRARGALHSAKTVIAEADVRLSGPASFRLARHGSQILSRRFGVRVVSAQYPLAVRERPLIQRDRLGRLPRSQVAHCEAVPRPQGVRVVGALHPLEQRGENSNQRNSSATPGEAKPSRPILLPGWLYKRPSVVCVDGLRHAGWAGRS